MNGERRRSLVLAWLQEAISLERNRALLDALRAHSNLKAAAFLCGKNIDNPLGQRTL